MALYRFQVVDADGRVILPPFRPIKQRHGTIDVDLVETCVEQISRRMKFYDPKTRTGWRRWVPPSGPSRTQLEAEQAIRDGIVAAIQELKDDLAIGGGQK
jgi:hypothetical protein